MRPPPTTAEILEEFALRDAARPALREQGVVTSYGALCAMVMQCGLQLQRLGVARGDRVAVAGPGLQLQLVLLLAAESLGAATASFQAENDPDAAFLFTQVQWVLSARPQQVPADARFVLVDEAFLRVLGQPLAGEYPAWSPLALQEPQRISRTSGSSGSAKWMVLNRAAQEYWVRMSQTRTGGERPRLLVLGPLVINAAFTRCSACLRQGGLLLVGEGRELPELDPTAVWGLPLQIERLLAEAPAGYVAPRPVGVASLGGLATPALRARAEAVFGGAISNRYGSNEAGVVCEGMDAAGVGVLGAGVDVRILDGAGRELPPGQQGIIAVRTPSMAEGYLQRPEESAAAFRDGWFVTGDVGVLLAPRRLRLLGRHDDLVNVGGVKLPAQQIESALRALPAIADCAVQAVHLEGGEVTLGVALVLAGGATPQQAQAQLRDAVALPREVVVRVLYLSRLPALASGKLDRMGLLRLFQAG